MHEQRVRPLVEGAFLALITAILGALAIYFLPVKFLVDFVWGIPIILIIKRYDLRLGLLTLMTTFFITWILTEPVTTLLLVVELAPLALAFGLLFKYETSPGITLVVGSLVSILATVLTILGFSYLANINMLPTEHELRVQMGQTAKVYFQLGLIDKAQINTVTDKTVKLMLTLFPSALAIASILRALFTYIVAVKVLGKLNYKMATLPPFREWRLPWYSIWTIIVGLGLSLIGDQLKLASVSAIGKNILFIVAPIFFLIGTAVAAYFLNAWKMPSWTKALIVIMSIINLSGSLILFTLLGIFDPVVSFRSGKKTEEG